MSNQSISQENKNKQRLIHKNPTMISVSALYEFIQFDAFGTTAFNVSRVLHCLAKRMAPGPKSTKDVASCVWLSLDGFVDISRGRLDKPKASKAIKWLRDRGLVVEKKIGNTVYRALSQSAIDRLSEYAVTTVVDSTTGGCAFHNGGVVDSTTNRGSEEGKKIGSSSEAPTRPAEIAGKPQSATSKRKTTTTTKFSLSGFYDAINNITGTALPKEKNQAFQVMLDRHGRDGFAHVLSRLSIDGMKFVWTVPMGSRELDYSCMPEVFYDLLEEGRRAKE